MQKTKLFSKIPTIRDIAKEANVSIATVSRAISGKEGVGPDTREKILGIIKRFKYFPNLQARGLVSRHLESIGIIIPRTAEYVFSNPFYSEVLKGISAVARKLRYYLLFSFADDNSYSQMYHNRLAAGIIVITNRIDDPKVEDLIKNQIPLVLIPGDPKRNNIPSVNIDNITGAFEAITYLINLGHRRIGFLSGSKNSRFSIERLLGFREAMEHNHLPIKEEFILETDFVLEKAYESMKNLISMENPPTGVFVVNDYCALGALKAAKEKKLKVPQDISIVGFGDIPIASMTDPPLTTIHEPFQEMGGEAVEMLLKIINKKRLPKKEITLSVYLNIRETAAPPKIYTKDDFKILA